MKFDMALEIVSALSNNIVSEPTYALILAEPAKTTGQAAAI
jgi:hypothetical protein